MNTRQLWLLLALVFLGMLSCTSSSGDDDDTSAVIDDDDTEVITNDDDTDDPNIETLLQPDILQDSFGRQLILHGLNTSGEAKSSIDHLPYISEDDVQRELDSGFNVVRYLLIWAAIEPVQGVINHDYLDETEKRIRWYTERGIHVILDMHQDNFSDYFNQFTDPPFGGACCIGAPDWAVITEDQPHIDVDTALPLSVDILQSPDFSTAWSNFWDYEKYPHLQDSYIKSWQEVVNRFKDNPFVLGYEPINEPGTGSMASYMDGSFERDQLKPFYDRTITAIRELDPIKYILINPSAFPSNQGGESVLPVIDDPSTEVNRLVFATHCYTRASGASTTWFGEVEKQRDLRNSSVFVGEFDCGPDEHPADAPELSNKELNLTWMLSELDDRQYHWAYWSNTIEDTGLIFMTPNNNTFNPDRSEKSFYQWLIRVYPKATAGRILAFDYKPFTREFQMVYTNNSDIDQPTEIFIPDRHYPDGWELAVITQSDYFHEFDRSTGTLLLHVSEDNAEVQVSISPK